MRKDIVTYVLNNTQKLITKIPTPGFIRDIQNAPHVNPLSPLATHADAEAAIKAYGRLTQLIGNGGGSVLGLIAAKSGLQGDYGLAALYGTCGLILAGSNFYGQRLIDRGLNEQPAAEIIIDQK